MCPSRLELASYKIKSAIQQRLSSRSTKVVVDFDLDVYSHIFNSESAVILTDTSDIESKLSLCKNWTYKIKTLGRAVRVSMPIRFVPNSDKNGF